MKKIFTVFIIIFLSGCGWIATTVNKANKTKQIEESKQIVQALSESGDCEIKRVEKEVRGSSMAPLIKNKAVLTLLEGYYDCYKPRKGDIVAYNYSGNDNPTIKRIMVDSFDTIELRGNNLIVNEKILKNSAGQKYGFTSAQQKMLGLYIKNKHLSKDAYFIFGDSLKSSIDSRRFGAVEKNGFIGKFE